MIRRKRKGKDRRWRMVKSHGLKNRAVHIR